MDSLSEEVVKVYPASDPENPKVYRHAEIDEAEPAVPGWRMSVDELFHQVAPPVSSLSRAEQLILA